MAHFHRRHHHHHSSHNHYHGCHGEEEDGEEEDPHWHDQIDWFHDAHEWPNDYSSGHQEDEFATPQANEITNSSRTTWPPASHSENAQVVAMYGKLMGNNPYDACDRFQYGHSNGRNERMYQKQVFASLLDSQESQETANSIPSQQNDMDMGISSNDTIDPDYDFQNNDPRTTVESDYDSQKDDPRMTIESDYDFQKDDPRLDENAQRNKSNYGFQADDEPIVDENANENDHDEITMREVFLKCPEDVKNLLRDRLEELARNANQNTVRSCLGPSIDDALFRLYGVVRRWLNSWTAAAGSGECACGKKCGAMTTCALKWLHHEYLTLADELVAASKLNDGGRETRRLASKRKLLDGLTKLLNDDQTQKEFAKSSSSPTSPSLIYDDSEEEVGDWDQNSSQNSIVRESVQEANLNQVEAAPNLAALAQSSKPRGNICKGGACGGGCSGRQNCQKMSLGNTAPVTNYSEMSREFSNQENNKPIYSSQAFNRPNMQRVFRMRRIEDSKPCICQREDILVHGKRNSPLNTSVKRNSFAPSSFMRDEERQKKKLSQNRMKSKALERNSQVKDLSFTSRSYREPQYHYWPSQHQYNLDISHPPSVAQNGPNEYEEQMRALKDLRHTLHTIEEPADLYQEPSDTGCHNPCCEKLKSCAPYDVKNLSNLSDSGISPAPAQPPTPPLREESKKISSASMNYNRRSSGELKKMVSIEDKNVEIQDDSNKILENGCPTKKEEEEMLFRIMTKLNLIEERLDREQTSKEVAPVKCTCLDKGKCVQEDNSIYCRCLVKGQCVPENSTYCPRNIEENNYDTIPNIQEFSVPIDYNNWNQYYPPRNDHTMNLTNSFLLFVNRTWQDLKSHFKLETSNDVLYDINVQDNMISESRAVCPKNASKFKKRTSRRRHRRASSRHYRNSSESSLDLSKNRERVLRRHSSRKRSSSSEDQFPDNNYKISKKRYTHSRHDNYNRVYELNEDRNNFGGEREPSSESKKSFFRYLLHLRKSKRSNRKRKEQKINLLYSRGSSDDSSIERCDRDCRNLFDIIYEPKFPGKKLSNPRDPSHTGWEDMQYKLGDIPSQMYLRLVKDRSPFPMPSSRNVCVREDVKPSYEDKSAQISRSPTFEDAATHTEENICANNLASKIQSPRVQTPREYQKQRVHTPPTLLYRTEIHGMDEIPVKDISFQKPKRDENAGLCLHPGSSVGHALKQIGQLDGVKIFKRSSCVTVDPVLGARITQLHAKVSKGRKDLNIKASQMKQQISNQSLAALLAERSKLLRERDHVTQTTDNISSLISSSSNQRLSLVQKKRDRRQSKRRQKELRKQTFGVHNSLYKTVTGTLGAWLANNWQNEELERKNQKKY